MAEDVFPPEPVPRRRTPAGRAIATLLATLVLGTLVCADGLEQTATRLDYGWQRTTALALVHPVQDISHVTGLSLPRRWLADATGREDPTTSDTGTETVVTAPPTTAGATTSTVPVTRRRPTDDDPLRVWVGGDSLAGNLGDGVTKALEGSPAEVTKDVQVATGLARPDVLDWPTHLAQTLADTNPEVMVFTAGGNDDQPLEADGRFWNVGSPQWKAEYQRRVAAVLQAAAKPGRTIIWVGLPTVDKADLQAAVPTMNAVVAREAAARPDVVFYDPTPVLTPGGKYRQYDGATKLRDDDGVHPTHAGADRVAAKVAALFAVDRHLRPR